MASLFFYSTFKCEHTKHYIISWNTELLSLCGIFLRFIVVYLSCSYVYGRCVCTCRAHTRRSGDHLQYLAVLFHWMDARDWTQAVRLSTKCPYLLSICWLWLPVLTVFLSGKVHLQLLAFDFLCDFTLLHLIIFSLH